MAAHRAWGGTRRFLGVAILASIFNAWNVDDADAQNVTVKGRASFEKVPVAIDSSSRSPYLQLNLPALPKLPISGSPVELIAKTGGEILGSCVTDRNGDFRLTVELDDRVDVYMRVLATAGNAQVTDLSSPPTLYAIRGLEFSIKPGDEIEKNMVALDSNRGSGPFNLLDLINKTNKLIRSAQPALNLPSVVIHWSTNSSEGSYFDPSSNQAYIKGDRKIDSDEFDDHVVIHEYGHFIAANFSRDDSPGGPHSIGDRVDPRLAWSEGWATFLACATL